MNDRLGILPHVVEAILNHVSGSKGGVAGVYNKALYLRERVDALNLWADHLTSIVEGRETTSRLSSELRHDRASCFYRLCPCLRSCGSGWTRIVRRRLGFHAGSRRAQEAGVFEMRCRRIVITKLAEACEAGDLASACKESSAYIHHLGPEIWRAPHWRSYFATGTIDTDLPRLRDGKRTGETVRCERVPIYVRKDSLAEFIKSHEPTPAAARRYPGDARLIEEGRRMVANGMEKRAVARKLAEQAEGASFDAKVDRLRRAL